MTQRQDRERARRLDQASDEAVQEALEESAVVEEQADPTRHILLDLGATGEYVRHDQPVGWHQDRTVTIDGVTYEHCGEGPNGVWQYRRM